MCTGLLALWIHAMNADAYHIREFGQVEWFDDRLGVGCLQNRVRPEKIYFRYNDIAMPGHRTAAEGSPVSFVRELTDSGLRARNIQTIFSKLPWQQPRFRLTQRFLKWMHKTNRVRYMWSLKDGRPVVNLVRYYIIVTSFFEVYIHQFLDDDESVLHNHPWWFVSLLLQGSYIEEGTEKRIITRRAGSILFRRHNYLHRVKLDEFYKGITFTLIATGRRKSTWRFFDPTTTKFLTPADYGKERGASVLLFNDLHIRGRFLPRIEGGTNMPQMMQQT